MVFDVRGRTKKPLYQSTVRTNKHTDPVWEVRWVDDPGTLNFFSVSSDGRVTDWFMMKNKLESEEVMELKLMSSTEQDDETSLTGLAGGLCFDLNPRLEHLFLVGTEEGWIHKCSKAYNSEYLQNYSGHYMAVYTVRWNPFHHKVFASCSADWTAKLWDHTTSNALLSFDLNVQVGDLAWSPWSSTTFAACTADGKVHVFDLNENKNEPYCEQKAVRKAKLTKVAFNSKSDTPIIAVGDDHGCVTTMKPSPNLRWTAVTKAEAEKRAKEEAEAAASGGPRRGAKKAAEPAGEGAKKVDPHQLEIDKFDKLLEQAHKNQITEQ